MKFYGFGSGIPVASVAKLNYVMSIHGGYCNQKVSLKCLFNLIILSKREYLIDNWCRIYLICQKRGGGNNEKNLSFSI
ncbi:hypothetical protein, partial [Sulfuricurvum sp. RIFOXYD12_FULL_44_77]|uniref:hypothetical protein n=1 Tax=Sulfuricurvum sp. RIFOXYD12_FULL_44_77 TaxID=1802248 RepID=UPI0025EB08A3